MKTLRDLDDFFHEDLKGGSEYAQDNSDHPRIIYLVTVMQLPPINSTAIHTTSLDPSYYIRSNKQFAIY